MDITVDMSAKERNEYVVIRCSGVRAVEVSKFLESRVSETPLLCGAEARGGDGGGLNSP